MNANLSLGGDESNIPNYAIEYDGLAVDLPIYADACCALWFHVPIESAKLGSDEIAAWLVPIAERLHCDSAYAEIALEGHMPRMQAAAKRFLAVDISDISCVARDLGLNVPDVHWINYFGPGLLARLESGGVNVKAPREGCSTLGTDGGGLLLTFGNEPDLGDQAFPASLTPRRALARQLHAVGLLHVPARITYFDSEDDVDDRQAQRRWHLRLAQ